MAQNQRKDTHEGHTSCRGEGSFESHFILGGRQMSYLGEGRISMGDLGVEGNSTNEL